MGHGSVILDLYDFILSQNIIELGSVVYVLYASWHYGWGFEGNGGNCEAAAKIGKLIGERAVAAGITEVVFDRGGNVYHGRVKALAEGAREGGLKF